MAQKPLSVSHQELGSHQTQYGGFGKPGFRTHMEWCMGAVEKFKIH